MRGDWDRRARADAFYYVALGHKGAQSLDEFLTGAHEAICGVEAELERLEPLAVARTRRALEIGCGVGRLMLPLSTHFTELHGLDVSPEMIRLARGNLSGVSHAHLTLGDGAGLAAFAADYFDFVYSFAVFQHIPSRDVIFHYLKEIRRVLKPGGIARLNFNGKATGARRYDTWTGARVEADEIARFAQEHDFQLLALEGTGTEYMWSTFAKRQAGWYATLFKEPPRAPDISILRIADTVSSGSCIPAYGRHAAFSLVVEGLPADADLNTLGVYIGGCKARLTYLSVRHKNGHQHVTGLLPSGLKTGLQSVHAAWLGISGGSQLFVRLIPAAPVAPRILWISDSMYPGMERCALSGNVRIHLEGTRNPGELVVTIAARKTRILGIWCLAPSIPRFQIDCKLPRKSGTGTVKLECRLGSRYLGTFELAVRRTRVWWFRRFLSAEFYAATRRWFRAWRSRYRQNRDGYTYTGS